MKYSLADYILSIKTDDPSLQAFGAITVGGEGSATDSMGIELDNNMWETTSFATGAWIHSKNLARSGKIDITLSQLSDRVAKFMQLANVFYSGDYQGLTLSLTDSTGQNIATCIDCYFVKIPRQEFSSRAANQTWQLTSGKITFS